MTTPLAGLWTSTEAVAERRDPAAADEVREPLLPGCDHDPPRPGAALALRAGDQPIELLLLEVREIDPGVRHLVHRAIAPADPLARIGIVRIVRGVVVPRREDEHGALRQERRGVVGIDVVDVPVPLEAVDGAQHFLAAVGIDRLHRHRLAAHVHVRLEILHARRRLDDVEVLRHRHFARRDVELRAAADVEHPKHGAVLRHRALRIEVDAELDLVVLDLLADREHVDLPADLRAGQHQLAGVRR